jgi:hypothetical protein
VRTATLRSLILGTAFLVTLSAPAAAQIPAATSSGSDSEFGLMYSYLHFGYAGANFGVNADYGKILTKPSGGWGLRWGAKGDVGFHHFSGYSFGTFQGGATLTSEKYLPRLKPYLEALVGIGHFTGVGSSTDTLLTLGFGGDIPLAGKAFDLRIQIDSVHDFFSGGNDVAWRYSVGVAVPIK